MIFPVNLNFGNYPFPLHLLFEIMAYSLGYRYYHYLRGKTTDLISSENRYWIFIGAAFGAFLGSRLLGLLEHPYLLLHPPTYLYYFTNKTIVGGLLGGLIGVELIKKKIGVNTSSGDLMTFPLLLAIIIGRLGCFFAGLEDGTYGQPTTIPWAIDFGDGLKRHPTNLYEILFLLTTWVFLHQLENRFTLKNGARFKLFLAGYLLFRLLIEFIKPVPVIVLNLSAIQLACIAGLVYYYKVLLYPQTLFKAKTSCPKEIIPTTTLP